MFNWIQNTLFSLHISVMSSLSLFPSNSSINHPLLCLKWLHVQTVALSSNRLYVLRRSVAKLLYRYWQEYLKWSSNVSVVALQKSIASGKFAVLEFRCSSKLSVIYNKRFHRNNWITSNHVDIQGVLKFCVQILTVWIEINWTKCNKYKS